MKQLIKLLLVLSFCYPMLSRQEKNIYLSQIQSRKKHGVPKIQSYNQPTVVSVDTDKTFGETLGLLKRRYPRNYNLKYNREKLEQDDFGYAPENKKLYRI